MRSLSRATLAIGLALGLFCSGAWAQTRYRTLTHTPHDTNGPHYDGLGPRSILLDNGRVVLCLSGDGWEVNHLNAMGAEIELFNDSLGARLGVWTDKKLAHRYPKRIVAMMARSMRHLTGGSWSPTRRVDIAGIPVYRCHGVDAFGNYAYAIYAFRRFGQTYAFATRTAYSNRHNRRLNAELAYAITHIHPTTNRVK